MHKTKGIKMEIILILSIATNFAMAGYFLFNKKSKCSIDDYYIKSGRTLNCYKYKNTVKLYK